MADQLVIAEGTTLDISATLPTPAAGAGKPLLASDFAAIMDSFVNVPDITDMPTPDPTRTESRVTTLDRGEKVGGGTTTRATQSFTTLANEDIAPGYLLLFSQFEAKLPVACKLTYTDGTVKWYIAHITGAQEAAPVGGNFQMAVGLAVQGEVVTVRPA